MARSRLVSNPEASDPTIDEIAEALEDALEFSPPTTESSDAGVSFYRSAMELNDLRDLMRATAEKLEFEAAQMRWQLELLETSAKPAWYH